jgi:hypothetical protein
MGHLLQLNKYGIWTGRQGWLEDDSGHAGDGLAMEDDQFAEGMQIGYRVQISSSMAAKPGYCRLMSGPWG